MLYDDYVYRYTHTFYKLVRYIHTRTIQAVKHKSDKPFGIWARCNVAVWLIWAFQNKGCFSSFYAHKLIKYVLVDPFFPSFPDKYVMFAYTYKFFMVEIVPFSNWTLVIPEFLGLLPVWHCCVKKHQTLFGGFCMKCQYSLKVFLCFLTFNHTRCLGSALDLGIPKAS